MNAPTLTAQIKAKALELGFSGCGIIKADPIEEYTTHLDERIRHFPESRAVYEPLRSLAFPRQWAEWGRSVVVCTMPYNRYRIPEEAARHFGKLYLFDGRLNYAPEYSSMEKFEAFLREKGFQTFKGYISARWAAQKAGLGRFGRNNFIYTERDGSWVWIETWIVDVELKVDEPSKSGLACPPNCRRCIDACPTQALSEPLVMDRGRCIPHLCYHSDKLPSEEFRNAMGLWVYGCDICQDVCPLNKNKWKPDAEFPRLNSYLNSMRLENILAMDEAAYHELIHPRYWYISKDRLWLWRCNALRAMTNSGDPSYYEAICRARTDRDEQVRAMAHWACDKLGL